MIPLKLLIPHKKIKFSKSPKKSAGFTLIELLVAMILASLILTPLLTFMINIMQADQREQAKSNTEQELKSAIDFIARDLEQAVYIYDAAGINGIKSELPPHDLNTHFPVLVFWKRQYIKDGIGITTSTNCTTQPGECDDTFSYSLVAYYLIKDNSNSTWSKAARIGRFQISDGYGVDDTAKDATRDDGFQLFDITGPGDLISKMNRWTSGTYTSSSPKILTLVDYIEQTQTTTNNFALSSCPTTPTNSFYVCVDSANTVAEVYLRGNALARIENTPPTYTEETKNYFPQTRVRVEGRGFVFTK
ncbi:hormogonium polysaccharide secretion pseudopilin HpsC [Calothrix sp. CCY 0018]|uniref:hormogonium polysaccharide secretion pseudopilin HpsC n=1 Tax=Calothrix sp. CCY 0018 TaxID=3103864 RepID=UPI0039C5CA71